MSDSSPNLLVIAVIVGIVVGGGYLVLRGTPEPVDTVLPVAVAGSNIEVEVGESFILDGSESSDNVGITAYTWQLGSESENEAIVTFTIEEEGVYFATLIVKDETGNSAQETIQITVNAQPDVNQLLIRNQPRILSQTLRYSQL